MKKEPDRFFNPEDEYGYLDNKPDDVFDKFNKPKFAAVCKKCKELESELNNLVEAAVPYSEQIKQLQAENERLKAALIQHRADLHCGSGRPCGTCKQSAEALGIDVPDRCAQAHIDKQALKRESK